MHKGKFRRRSSRLYYSTKWRSAFCDGAWCAPGFDGYELRPYYHYDLAVEEGK